MLSKLLFALIEKICSEPFSTQLRSGGKRISSLAKRAESLKCWSRRQYLDSTWQIIFLISFIRNGSFKFFASEFKQKLTIHFLSSSLINCQNLPESKSKISLSSANSTRSMSRSFIMFTTSSMSLSTRVLRLSSVSWSALSTLPVASSKESSEWMDRCANEILSISGQSILVLKIKLDYCLFAVACILNKWKKGDNAWELEFKFIILADPSQI